MLRGRLTFSSHSHHMPQSRADNRCPIAKPEALRDTGRKTEGQFAGKSAFCEHGHCSSCVQKNALRARVENFSFFELYRALSFSVLEHVGDVEIRG